MLVLPLQVFQVFFFRRYEYFSVIMCLQMLFLMNHPLYQHYTSDVDCLRCFLQLPILLRSSKASSNN
ncbi:hypothetical protein BpHYR1_026374 [Brachionus plicatilis]|uniref:Uncharacterized protein n=1 Tax=Brachionus plicatilis TaxID=10195 RepID=A0A3M7RR16_BRAPC|nr:hypothetical protein BpHYR1_026374 [Brachionus plicatilis]